MEWPALLLVVGLVGVVAFTVVALRGSFKSDDEFYGESTTVTGAVGSADDHRRPGQDPGDGGAGGHDAGAGDAGAGSDGGASGGGSNGGVADGGGAAGDRAGGGG
jgi:hypothetical protein